MNFYNNKYQAVIKIQNELSYGNYFSTPKMLCVFD